MPHKISFHSITLKNHEFQAGNLFTFKHPCGSIVCKEVHNMIYQNILNERKRLEEQIKSLQLQLEKFPEGKLVCTHNGNRIKWFRSDGHHPVYIPKKERQLAEQLAHKKYLALQLKNLTREKTAIDFYLNHHDQNALQAEQSFINSPKYKELLAPIFTPTSQKLNNWANSPYEKNEKYPENLIHQTHSGNLVRSKSEALIDMFLFQNKIPFRYECMLTLDETFIYPDFTIRHPQTGQTYYWEHFGMMDNPAYCKNVFSKLQLYSSNGIIPTIQLITAYETKENPLSPDVVENIVQHYFLS